MFFGLLRVLCSHDNSVHDQIQQLLSAEKNDTETFKLYSGRKTFSLYNASVYVSHQSIVTNDAEFNIFSAINERKKKKHLISFVIFYREIQYF